MITITEIFHNVILACYIASFLGLCLTPLGKEKVKHGAIGMATLGLLAQLILLGLRWNASGHLPVTGLFETQHFLSMWVVAVTLYFHYRYSAERFLPAAIALAIAALLFADQGPKAIVPLTPAIDTPLFLIHVATSFAAYGLFGVAALLGVYRIAGLTVGSENDGSRILDESLYLGFILFTCCMIAGSLWAYLAWGSYWTWKIKGLWSYILWFYYGGVIHVRNRTGWKGTPVSLLAVTGFCLVLFTYLGLGLLFKTSHPLL